MEVDAKTDTVQSNDIGKAQNDESKDKETVVEQPKEKKSEAVPVVENSITEESAKSPVKNDIAPKEDAIETPKVETPPSPAKDSPVTRPIEEAAIPDAAKEPAEVNEKANDHSHAKNESVDAVIKENKTEEKIDDAPASKLNEFKVTFVGISMSVSVRFSHFKDLSKSFYFILTSQTPISQGLGRKACQMK